MKKHLTYKDAKSDKFWSIETNGKSFTVTYGKTGTSGTPQTKVFDSDAECIKEAEKLVNEKLKKGYGELHDSLQQQDTSKNDEDKEVRKTPGVSYEQKLNRLKESTDIQQSIKDHFHYLIENKLGYQEWLDLIFSRLKSVKIGENIKNKDASTMSLCFKGGVENWEDFALIDETISDTDDSASSVIMVCSMPAHDFTKYKKWPASFLSIVQHHEHIRVLHDDYCIFDLGDHGNCTITLGDLDPPKSWKRVKAKNILSPLEINQGAWWLYNPINDNKEKEPQLYFFPSEGTDVEKTCFEDGIGPLFVKSFAKYLGKSNHTLSGQSNNKKEENHFVESKIKRIEYSLLNNKLQIKQYRLGTLLEVTTEIFADMDEASSEYQNSIAKADAEIAKATPIETWLLLAVSEDKPSSVYEYLAFLAKTQDASKRLAKICETVTSIDVKESQYVGPQVEFTLGDFKLTGSLPTKNITGYPPVLAELLSKNSRLMLRNKHSDKLLSISSGYFLHFEDLLIVCRVLQKENLLTKEVNQYINTVELAWKQHHENRDLVKTIINMDLPEIGSVDIGCFSTISDSWTFHYMPYMTMLDYEKKKDIYSKFLNTHWNSLSQNIGDFIITCLAETMNIIP